MMFSKVSKSVTILAFLLLLGAATFTAAQADLGDEDTGSTHQTKEDMVQTYFKRCVDSVFQDLAPETREEFCACSSAQMSTSLTPMEIDTMANGKGKSIDPVTLANKVIAPCFSAPTDEIEYNACMNDVRFAHMFKSQDAYNGMCHCISSGISHYVADVGPELMAKILHVNPELAANPLEVLREAPEYLTERARLHKECLNNYAHN